MKRSFGRLLLAVMAVLLLTPVLGSTAGATPPSAPTITGPANSQVVQGNPIFTWTSVPNAVAYQIQVGTDSSFASVLVNQGTVNTKYVTTTVDLPQNTTGLVFLYARVLAINSANEQSPWSPTVTFTRAPASAPVILSPSNATDPFIFNYPGDNPEFTWNPVQGAKSYEFQWALDSGFSNNVTTQSTAKTGLIATSAFVFATDIYWHVRGDFTSGQVTQWSPTRRFQFQWNAVPTLLSPPNNPNNALPAIEDLNFSWQWLSGAQSYQIEYSPDINFATNVTGPITVASTTYAPQQHLQNASYFWRVRGLVNGNVTSAWSTTWAFTKAWPAPPYPTSGLGSRVVQLGPTTGSIVTTPTWTWTPFRLGASYEVQFSTDQTFAHLDGDCVTNHTELTAGACFSPGVNVVYYWRVRPIDIYGNVLGLFSNNGVGWTFQYTIPNVTLVSPASGATVSPPVLTWAHVTNIGKYRVTITDQNGNGGFSADTYQTSYVPQLPYNSGPYRWYVQGIDGNGQLAAFVVNGYRTFSVGAPTPVGATPDPFGGPFVGNHIPTLYWNAVAGADHYDIWFKATTNSTWTALASNLVQNALSYPSDNIPVNVYDFQVFAWVSGVSHAGAPGTFTETALQAASGGADQLAPAHCAQVNTCPTLSDTPIFEWTEVPGATGYNVILASDANFTHILSSLNFSTIYTRYTPTMSYPETQAGQATYWFVQPFWGQRVSYGPEFFPPPNHPPVSAFRKQSPAAVLTGPGVNVPDPLNPPSVKPVVANQVTFTWQDYLTTNTATPCTQPSPPTSVCPKTEAAYYEFQSSLTPDFLAGLMEDVMPIDDKYYTSTTTYPEGPVYWRVRAYDTTNNPLPWSVPEAVQKQASVLTLSTPAAGATLNSLPDFTWQAQDYAAKYQLQIFDNPGQPLGNPIYDITTAFLATSPFISMIPGQYGWRIRRYDAAGRPGPWSAVDNAHLRLFTYTGTAAILTSPPDQFTFPDNNLLFTWNPVDGTALYVFQSSTSASFSSIQEQVTTINTAYAPTAVYPNGVYYWRILNYDQNNHLMGTTTARSFTRGTPPPGPPGAPTAVNAVAGDASATVSWTPPASNGGSAITGYTVTASPGGQTCSATLGTSCLVLFLVNGTSYTFTVKATNALGTSPPSLPSNAVIPTAVLDYLHPQSPIRIIDSRPGLQVGPYNTPWGAGITRDVQITNNGGVPAGADAVVLNVTVTNPTASSFLTVFPAGTNRPNTSSLNFTAGVTIPNAVTVKVGAGGKISLFNLAGTVDVNVDVVGYYNSTQGDGFTSLSPGRITDSRASSQIGPYSTPWGSGTSRDVQVSGLAGVPNGADAVVLNVTATGPTASSFLTVWPQGSSRPNASSLNFVANQVIPNAVTVKLGPTGAISIYNLTGNVDVIVDVVGYFSTGSGKAFHTLPPSRIQDSRASSQVGGYSTPWGAGVTRGVPVAGVGGVPIGADSVLLNVTATGPTAPSFLTVWPTGVSQPNASSLNFVAGQVIPNAVTAKVGSSNSVNVFNLSGNVDVIADVCGYYA